MAYNKDEIKTPATPDIKPADDIAFFDMQAGTFFRRIDWSAFWTTFLGTFALYFFTLAPTVTLEDSGELAVASDYLGVPHPPGYPIWTLLTWLFQWIFHWGSYHGQPNPAWAVGLFSAFSGALACGLIALVVSRSGAHMLRSIKTITNVLGTSTENLICWVGGVVGGVLLALSPVLWSQSVIVEVYSLNALFFALIMVLTYRWMSRPKDDHILYIAAFMFGLGLTNHQTLVFLIFGLMAAIFFADRKLFRDALAVGAVILGLYLLWSVYNMNPGPNPTPEVMREKSLKIVSGLVFLVSPVGIFFLFGNQLMTEWKRVVITFVLIALGISFYSYMTFASEQNPPMNWGYPRTTEGFKHAITRGQYEKISPVDNFKDALSQNGRYGRLVHQVIFKSDDYISVVAQFTPYISIFALITMGMLFVVGRKTRQWIIVTIVTFVSLTFVFLIFQYPPLDVQSLFIGRVQYIQAHAVFAIWIAYGIIAVLAFLDMLLKGMKWATITFVILALLLPLLLIYRNAKDEEFIKIVGACEQNGHDFGWQFGNWQLRGAEGIKSDLTYKYGEEKGTEMWAEYPNPDYPPEMSTNAIFYGGTDPGRFVPTYMIYSAKVRPDVYLITQNALADNTYMNVMRDLYGDMIWIPSQQDSNRAFQQYVEDVQAGRIPPGAAVSFENGRVSVQGVQGVMMINGILAKMIFEHNKYKHDFFVEESYVIPWMYPYLEPHGLIMKINSEPIPELSETMVKNDMDFWAWYMELLLNDSNFTRDVVARKTFSKLRSAIAGLYAYRRMFNEAETAFRQAVDLYPLSPEANFRLADVYMQQGRYAEAQKLIEAFLIEDPGNDKVKSFLDQITGTQKANARRAELEEVLKSGKADINSALELATIYQSMGAQAQFQGLTMTILNDPNIPPQVYLQVAQLYANAKRIDLLEFALQRYVERDPNNARVMVDLAAAQAMLNKTNECVQTLKRSIELGGAAVRDIIRNDPRFNNVRALPEFQRLISAQRQGLPGNLQNLPGIL